MSSRSRAILIAAAFLLMPISAVGATEIPVSEVIEMAAELAGDELTVEGELVGDYGNRNDGSTWSQLNGDVYVEEPIAEGGTPIGANIGIGVRIPTDLMAGLDPPGGYRNRGPVVRLTGTWMYHDPQRQGESYLQVESLSIVEPGRRLDGTINWITSLVGALLIAGAGILRFMATRNGDQT